MANPTTARRSEQLFERLDDEVRTVVLTPGATMRYVTGLEMHQSERPTLVVLFRDRESAVVCPMLETDRVEEIIPDADRFSYADATDPVPAAREAFERLRETARIGEPIGVERRSTRLLDTAVFAPGNVELVEVDDAIAAVRSRKDADEIAAMRTAVSIIEEILEVVVDGIEPGIRERDVETEIRKRVLDSEAESFGVGIVTAGERTAYPHASTGHRRIERDELVMIDVGVVFDGYYSDITRTVAVGDPDDELVEIYDVVRAAASAARQRIGPGVACQEIDRAARAVIEDAGYGEYFPHRVGHGLGLEGHEPPYLVEGNDAPLQVGQTVTVEPGIYVPGLGGVRIEDDVVVDESGARVLTSFPRELRRL